MNNLFTGEPMPDSGTVKLSDTPGWGMKLNRPVRWLLGAYFAGVRGLMMPPMMP